jgi:5-(carboxyamino)imidazole ribonucleotide synthase
MASISRPDMQRLGIIGGGQLARMLAEAALLQGTRVVVLSPSSAVPAAIDGVELIIGELDDEAALAQLCARVDRVTIENEFLALDRIAAVLARHPQVDMHPSPASIAVAQDKLAQKQLFDRLGVATADWEVVDSERLPSELARLWQRFPGAFVLKWSRFGYDGRGNLVVRAPNKPRLEVIAEFCAAADRVGARVYAERLIDFRAELALVCTRTTTGARELFPLVVSEQEHGVCREVYGPATQLGFDAALERRAAGWIERIGDALELCGSFALELFLDRDGRLLANEMAPRVHNTGHYTRFADEPSQFDLHVRAVGDRPLPRPAVEGLVAMRNLLGPRWLTATLACPAPRVPPPPGLELEWYDKPSVSAGRKMGHLTGRARTPAELGSLRAAMAAYEQQLWATLLDVRAVS